MRCAATVVVLVSLVAQTAVAEPVSTRRRVAATVAAVFPGVLVRGLGSWLVREKRTAKRLFASGVVGLGGAVVGGVPVGVSGGSPYTTPGVPVLLAGTGLLLTTWIADIAVAAGLDRPGTPRPPAPWSVELGTTWLHDASRERGLARAKGTLELGRLGFGAGALVDPEGDALTMDGELRARILGAAATSAEVSDGSRLVVRAGLRRHRDDLDRVTLVTGEAELVARIDLLHLDPVLDGTFIDLALGLGIEQARYPTGASSNSSLLLGGFAWGAYLGACGEVRVFYDHRRDSLAGGLAAWRAAGFVGSFGASLELGMTRRWSVRSELEVGNAYVTTFAIRYRGGP